MSSSTSLEEFKIFNNLTSIVNPELSIPNLARGSDFLRVPYPDQEKVPDTTGSGFTTLNLKRNFSHPT